MNWLAEHFSNLVRAPWWNLAGTLTGTLHGLVIGSAQGAVHPDGGEFLLRNNGFVRSRSQPVAQADQRSAHRISGSPGFVADGATHHPQTIPAVSERKLPAQIMSASSADLTALGDRPQIGDVRIPASSAPLIDPRSREGWGTESTHCGDPVGCPFRCPSRPSGS
jgi:hypothetical protein